MESNTEQAEKESPAAKIINLNQLYHYLLQVKDGRKRRGIRNQIATIMVLMILDKLCGQNKVSGIADWVQQRDAFLVEALELKYKKLPHPSTYRRILTEVVVGAELEQLLSAYFTQTGDRKQAGGIAIDGKTVRGTISSADPFGLHRLAAYLPGEGIVLLQMVVEKDKENEIVIAPKLLKCLDLRQKVVIGDAMHTQRELSIQIVNAGGDYVWIVKDNQPKTRAAIEQLFAPEKPVPGLGCPAMDFATAQTTEKGHGRLEVRTLTVSSQLNDYLDWPYVGQVFKIERRFTYLHAGSVHHEIQYGLTSLTAQQASAERLLGIVRSEWGIENGLHYRRDVTFQEDQTRMTEKSMARAMAILNNLVIGLLNRQGYVNHAHARRVFDAHPAKALALISGL